MTIHIIYDQGGQPQQVFDTALAGYLRQGYSIHPPHSHSPQEENTLDNVGSTLSALVEMTGILDVNTASIKELQTLPDVAIALAKKIKGQRPYKDLTDLIQKVPELPWLDLRDRICLSDPTKDQSLEQTEDLEETTTETEIVSE